MKEIILIGSGKLAQSFFNRFQDFSSLPVKAYQSGMLAHGESIFLHIGSGRQYQESLTLAQENGSSFVQAATQKDFSMPSPKENRIIYIEAPNLDLNIIKLFYCLSFAKDLFNEETLAITESHQKEKRSLPGTALQFCEYLNIPPEDIHSIRDPDIQKELGIKNLDQHAYHKIKIGDEHSSLSFETKVEGSISYVKGFAKIADSIFQLDKGNYRIEDLISLGLI